MAIRHRADGIGRRIGVADHMVPTALTRVVRVASRFIAEMRPRKIIKRPDVVAGLLARAPPLRESSAIAIRGARLPPFAPTMDDPSWPAPAQRAFEQALKSTRSLPPAERWAAVAERRMLTVAGEVVMGQ